MLTGCAGIVTSYTTVTRVVFGIVVHLSFSNVTFTNESPQLQSSAKDVNATKSTLFDTTVFVTEELAVTMVVVLLVNGLSIKRVATISDDPLVLPSTTTDVVSAGETSVLFMSSVSCTPAMRKPPASMITSSCLHLMSLVSYSMRTSTRDCCVNLSKHPRGVTDDGNTVNVGG